MPPYYAALLAAGIRSGKLSEVLGTLTLYARSVVHFRETIVTVVLYPAIVLILGLVLMVFVSREILPQYEQIFIEMKLQLPLMTRIVLFVGQRPITFFVAPAVLILIGLLAERWWLRQTANGRILWARLVTSCR